MSSRRCATTWPPSRRMRGPSSRPSCDGSPVPRHRGGPRLRPALLPAGHAGPVRQSMVDGNDTPQLISVPFERAYPGVRARAARAARPGAGRGRADVHPAPGRRPGPGHRRQREQGASSTRRTPCANLVDMTTGALTAPTSVEASARAPSTTASANRPSRATLGHGQVHLRLPRRRRGGIDLPGPRRATGVRWSKALSPSEYSLWLCESELDDGGTITWDDVHGDDAVYVFEGGLDVDGHICPAGGAVIVESGARATARAVGTTRIAHYGTKCRRRFQRRSLRPRPSPTAHGVRDGPRRPCPFRCPRGRQGHVVRRLDLRHLPLLPPAGRELPRDEGPQSPSLRGRDHLPSSAAGSRCGATGRVPRRARLSPARATPAMHFHRARRWPRLPELPAGRSSPD